MEKNILQYKCYPHQQVVVFDLAPKDELKDKYLCLKCLATQSPNRQIETIQDAQQKFMEMKHLEFNVKENQLKSNLERLSNIQNQIKEFFEFFINKINESQKILKQRIQEEQNELNSLIKPQQEMQTEQDLSDLTNYINFGFNNNYNEMNPKQLAFINQVKQSLDYQIFEEHLQNITNSLESIFTKSLTKKQIQLIPSEDLQVDQNKFISLRYLCEIHKSNIIMISLEPGQIEQRMFCQYCIQGKKLDGLTSLFEVNKQWQNYTQNVSKNNMDLHNKRQNNQFKINELIKQQQKNYQRFYKGLNQLLINQNYKIIKEKNESQLINLNKQLYQMELNEIQQIVQQLLQQDKMREIQQKQFLVQREDQQFIDQISEQFNQLQKIYQQLNKKFSNYLV